MIPLIIEGKATRDGRVILRGATSWDAMPLPVASEFGSESGVEILELRRVGRVVFARLNRPLDSDRCLTADCQSVELEWQPSRVERLRRLLGMNPGGRYVMRDVHVMGATLSPLEAWAW